MNGGDKIPVEIRKLAWDWVSRIQSPAATEEDMQELAKWLNEDPAHMRAYTEYQETAWCLDELAALPEGAALRDDNDELASSHSIGFKGKVVAMLDWLYRPQAAWALAGFAAIAILTITVLQPAPTIHSRDYQTQVGEIHTLTLADGSTVTVGADSRIESEISSTRRLVRLGKGEAFFEVVSIADAPFWVEVDSTVVRVVGTRFNINRSNQRTKVSVIEGVVRVAATEKAITDPSASEAHYLELRAGQQVLHASGGDFSAIVALPTAEMESWRTGWLSYKSEPLIDVIADVNRYFKGEIVIGESRLDQIPVTLSISTSNISSIPDMLAASIPLEVVQKPGNHYVLMSKSAQQGE